MRTLGIVGGIGPESTIDYYRSIIAACRERTQDGSYPSLLINSIDVNRVLELVAAGALSELTSYLTIAVEQLARAGADLALIAANTPHVVFDAVSAGSPIPLVSIVRATCDATLAAGLHRVALLGTRFTMTGDFYPRVFEATGIELVIPDSDDQAFIHEKYTSELLNGRFLPETREGMVAIIESMRVRDDIEGVILAGTELPLLMRGSEVELPLLDTTQIHVKAAVTHLIS